MKHVKPIEGTELKTPGGGRVQRTGGAGAGV